MIHRVAKANGRVSTLTVQDLYDAALPYCRHDGDGDQVTTKFSTWLVQVALYLRWSYTPLTITDTCPRGLIKNSTREMGAGHIKALFKTPRLAYSTSLIIFICKLIHLFLKP